MSGFIFELIVVDTYADVGKAEATAINTENHRTHVTFVGQGICGLRYGPHRPNRLTRRYMSPSDAGRRWVEEELLPAMAKDYVDTYDITEELRNEENR